MRNIIKIVASLILSFVIAGGALLNTSTGQFSDKDIEVRANNYSLYIYKNAKEFLRVSPLDDYYYTSKDKRHMFESGNFKGFTKKTNTFLNFLYLISFNKDSFTRVAEGDAGTVEYTITKNQDKVFSLTRKLALLSETPLAVGHSIIICKSCIVVDNKNRTYFQQDLIEDTKFSLAQNLQIVPVIITDKVLPGDITLVTIHDENFNRLFSLPIEKDQQVFYDERWNLIEIKTFIDENNSATQQILFDQ